MKVLAINFGQHDASAALAIDGKLICADHEDRFTLQKHDAHYPKHAIQYCLSEVGLNASELDLVALCENPYQSFSRTLYSQLRSWPFSFKEFSHSMQNWLGERLWSVEKVCHLLKIESKKLKIYAHHEAHVLSSFYADELQQAAFLTIDALGEWECSTWGRVSSKLNEFHVQILEKSEFPESLGLVYSAVTQFLGFRANSAECSTMALAGFGKPKYLEQVEKIFGVDEKGRIWIDSRYFNFSCYFKPAYTKKFIEIFGLPRAPKVQLGFSLTSSFAGDSSSRRWANVASSFQKHLENCLLKLVGLIAQRTGEKVLCLSGGVAKNCQAVQKLIEAQLFDKLIIPPEPGDAGLAPGVAIHLSCQKRATKYAVNIGQDDLEIDPTYLQDFIYKKKNIHVQYFRETEELVDCVAEDLYRGKIVGWFQGASELGPRALGYRSMLMRPDELNLAKKLSAKVKKRAAFRPYALSFTDREAEICLESFPKQQAFSYMQTSWPVRDSSREDLKAGLHCDGTTRPQVCRLEENPRFYQLLTAFGRRFGKEVLLNTSFNEAGFPIVGDPYWAIIVFLRTEMDLLVLNDYVLSKVVVSENEA